LLTEKLDTDNVPKLSVVVDKFVNEALHELSVLVFMVEPLIVLTLIEVAVIEVDDTLMNEAFEIFIVLPVIVVKLKFTHETLLRLVWQALLREV
jgi:hypothetical protein